MAKNNIKILIATGIYPPDIGGPATMLEALALSLRAEGFGVKVITYSAQKLSEPGVYRVAKNKVFSRLHYFLAMLFLSFNVDLIYVTDIYSVGWFANLLKKLIGKKYLIRFAGDAAWETATSNGWTTDYITDFEKNTYSQQIEKMKARRRRILTEADAVIAVSNFMGDLAKLIGVEPAKINVIHNAIDFGNEVKAGATRPVPADLPGDGQIIMTACRLTKWKGVDRLIKAMPEIIKRLSRVYLVILGDGPELENLRQLVQSLNLTEQIKFLNRVPHESVLKYLSRADVFVLNTNYEGLSHTLLEAMKAGVPVIATNVGGNPEVITDGRNGLLIDYNNQNQLTEAICRLLADRPLAKSLAEAATVKLKDFSWRQTVAKTVDLLKKMQ